MQINIIDLISKKIHKKINEELHKKRKGNKKIINGAKILYINKKNNFQ